MSNSTTVKWILIVEDELDLRDLMTDKLTRAGFRVVGCGTVSEALQRCAIQRFGCIILDFELDKGGTGAEIVLALRKNSFGLNYATPILMISAHLSSEIVKLIADKISSALVKPFVPDVFLEKVKQLCPLTD